MLRALHVTLAVVLVLWLVQWILPVESFSFGIHHHHYYYYHTAGLMSSVTRHQWQHPTSSWRSMFIGHRMALSDEDEAPPSFQQQQKQQQQQQQQQGTCSDDDDIGLDEEITRNPSAEIDRLKADMKKAQEAGDMNRVMTIMGTLLALGGGYEGESGPGSGSGSSEGKCAD